MSKLRGVIAVRRLLAGLLASGVLCAAAAESTTPGSCVEPTAVVQDCASMLLPAVPPVIAARVTCYRMDVPQDRTDPKGARRGLHAVSVAFSVLHPVGGTARGEPLVVFAGGVGQQVARQGFGARIGGQARVEYLAPGRDIILIDHRGAGLSEPSLSCPGVSDGDLSATLPTDADLSACKQAWAAAGIEPSLFTAAEAAQDAIDVRRALHVASWNVYGFSYGTTQALELLRRDGGAVRAIALDGVSPPNANSFSADYRLDPLLDTLSACAADAACQRQYPDLVGQLSGVVARLPDDPNFDPYTQVSPTVSRQRFLAALRVAVELPDPSGNSQRGEIPKAIQHARQGDFSVWQPMADNLDASYPVAGLPVPQTALTFASYVCGHDVGWRDVIAPLYPADRAVPAVVGRSMWSDGQDYPRLCLGLGIRRGPISDQLPAVSSRPALLLAGEIDSATPRSWALRAASSLRKSQAVTFRNTGHTPVLQQFDCGAALVSAFFAAPQSAVDPSCAMSLPATVWDVSP